MTVIIISVGISHVHTTTYCAGHFQAGSGGHKDVSCVACFCWLVLIIGCTIRTCRLVLRNLRSYLSVCPESSLAEPHLRFKSVHRCPFSQSSPLGHDCVFVLCPKLSVAPTTCWESQSLQRDFCPQKLQGLQAFGSHPCGSVFRHI